MEQNNENFEQTGNLSLKDWISICLSRWRWFVVSLIICLLVATVYILRTPPVYTRSASLLIKEDAKGRSVSTDIASTFSDLGLTRGRVNVNNEIISFQSPDLMTEVVKRLHLETEYKREARFYDRTLYGDKLPLVVEFPEFGNSESASFTLRQQGDSTYLLSKFVHNGEKLPRGETAVVAAGDTADTPIGKVIISPSAYADKNPFN